MESSVFLLKSVYILGLKKLKKLHVEGCWGLNGHEFFDPDTGLASRFHELSIKDSLLPVRKISSVSGENLTLLYLSEYHSVKFEVDFSHHLPPTESARNKNKDKLCLSSRSATGRAP